MKNYSKTFEESRGYILSYKIENDKIVMNLANMEQYTIPYSKDNEKTIVSRMERQARQARVKPLSLIDKCNSFIYPLSLPIVLAHYANQGGFLRTVFTAAIAYGAVYFPSKAIINVIKRRDVEKLNLFLDNKEELNKGISKSENMKLGVSKKAIKEIETQKGENKQPININNIDNYSLNDLRRLKDNLERIALFGFDEEEKSLEDRKKELISRFSSVIERITQKEDEEIQTLVRREEKKQ